MFNTREPNFKRCLAVSGYVVLRQRVGPIVPLAGFRTDVAGIVAVSRIEISLGGTGNLAGNWCVDVPVRAVGESG